MPADETSNATFHTYHGLLLWVTQTRHELAVADDPRAALEALDALRRRAGTG
ncbi:MAG: hypothetical protein GY711_31760 [bacterium]|nr:hypothetical protein [bacterium]